MVIVRMETPEDKAPRFPLRENAGTILTHTIRFRRPETPYSVSKMTAPNEREAMTQMHRLEALGYSIIDVIPPITGLKGITEAAHDDLKGVDTTTPQPHSA